MEMVLDAEVPPATPRIRLVKPNNLLVAVVAVYIRLVNVDTYV